MGELRAHSVRWMSISGSMGSPLSPHELSARIPHAVLSDRFLWDRVVKRVQSDASVRRVPAGHNETGQEGWYFYQAGMPPVR